MSQSLGCRPKGQLPDEPFVQLTEAITWILTGCSRNDEQVSKDRARTERKNQEQWWDSEGPGWLKPCLERLSAGPKMASDVAETNLVEQEKRDSAAKRWLEQSGRTAAVAYADVCAELTRQQLAAARRNLLLSLLFKGVAGKRFELFGLLHESHTRRPPIEFTSIPWQYFLRPTYQQAGKGFFGNGEIGPVPATGAGVFESVFSDAADVDRRATYLQVKISRGDAENLKAEYDQTEVNPPRRRAVAVTSMADAETQCQAWLEGHMRASPHRNTKTKKEWLAEALSRFKRVSQRGFRDRCWPNAIKAAGAEAWRVAGRKSNR